MLATTIVKKNCTYIPTCTKRHKELEEIYCKLSLGSKIMVIFKKILFLLCSNYNELV